VTARSWWRARCTTERALSNSGGFARGPTTECDRDREKPGSLSAQVFFDTTMFGNFEVNVLTPTRDLHTQGGARSCG